MKLLRLTALLVPVACATTHVASPPPEVTQGRIERAPDSDAKEKAALAAAVDGVVYGLPLVLEDITKTKTTNVTRPEGMSAPIDQFVHARTFPGPSFKDVVRPNVDTLYSAAFLDLSKEPMVLALPDTHGRYYLMPMLDAWTNVFASPGKRTTGTKAQQIAITGPGWSGTLPAGVSEVKAPTNVVWIIGRTQTNGPNDYAAVHAIQDGYKLVPLSAFGKPYSPPRGVVDPNVDTKTPPVEQVSRMTSAAFFDRLAMLMRANPPPPADAPMLAKLRSIGVVSGERFDVNALDPAVARGVEPSLRVALDKLQSDSKKIGTPVNGWRMPAANLGNYGVDYETRAVVALIGLGANLPRDAVYPSAFDDGAGQPLDGANRYVIHFDKGAAPPANAFWSITMYDANSFLVPNAIDRYAISSWMPLEKNADGSVDLYIESASPGAARSANWLPAARGPFSVTMRLYWPKDTPPSILDGTWKPPAIQHVE